MNRLKVIDLDKPSDDTSKRRAFRVDGCAALENPMTVEGIPTINSEHPKYPGRYVWELRIVERTADNDYIVHVGYRLEG